jgi:transcriptional regulator with XRE-family HTH domain
MTFLNKKEQSERLKTIRIKKFDNISQSEFALLLQYERGYLSNVENARSPITFILLERLSILYKEKTQQHLNLNWLLLGFGDMSVENSQGQENNGIINIGNNINNQVQNLSDCKEQIKARDITIAELKTEIKILREFLPARN